MKIPFDIKFRPQIESGEYKVETRDGRPVRIICWDRVAKENTDTDLNLCVLVPENNGEYVFYYHQSGKIWVLDKKFDLYIITPEPELSEWETFISGCLQKHGLLDCGAADRIAQNCSAELLALATEELKKTFVLLHKDDYQTAFDLGKAEALKDLPRWKRWGNGACGNGRGIPLAIVKRGLNGYEIVDALGIQGEQYIMLSDFEKLPGFNE